MANSSLSPGSRIEKIGKLLGKLSRTSTSCTTSSVSINSSLSGNREKVMKLVGDSSEEGSSVLENCVEEKKDVSLSTCGSETFECIVQNNDETILSPKEFFDSQRYIVESLSYTKPRHLMSKQSTKERPKTSTVGIESDDNMESSKSSTSRQSSSTISTLGKTSNVDVESSEVSRISPHSTSK